MSEPFTINALAGRTPPLPRLSDAVLLIIDAQNEYLDGPLRLDGVEAAVAVNSRLLAAARAAGTPVIHVAHAGQTGGMFDRSARRGAIVEDLTPLAGEPVVEKRLASAFTGTDLDQHLGRIDRKALIITGFMTHNCVSSTARQASEKGFAVTVIADAAATRALPDGRGGHISAADLHRAELAGLSDALARIATSAEILGG